MDRDSLVTAIEEILKSKNIDWKIIDLGSSTVIGIEDVVCFEVTNGGFSTIVNPTERETLEERKEALTLTNDLIPIDDKLFIDVKDGQLNSIEFWVNKALDYLKVKKADNFKHFVDPSTPVQKKLFFNLHIYTYDGNNNYVYLTFRKNGMPQYIADRVMPGGTLNHAITNELRKDFGIEQWRFIHPVTFSDDTLDNAGRPVQRVHVFVKVPHFDVGNRQILSMDMQWKLVEQQLATEVTDEEPRLGSMSSDECIRQAQATFDPQFIEDLRNGKPKDIPQLWKAFIAWLAQASPEQYAKLNPPASFKDIEDFARETGYALPENVSKLYRLNNGGETAGIGNSILGLEFLPVNEVIEEWKSWRSVEQGAWLDGEEPTYPQDAIKNTYANPKWIPLLRDGGGNNIGIDLDPGVNGRVGQVINFGRDERSKFVIADNLEEFLSFLLLQFADGNVGVALDEDFSWYLGEGSSHLTDQLMDIIVPKDFNPILIKKEAEAELLGFYYYDEYQEGKVVQSFSVSLERKDCEIAIQSGSKELKRIFRDTTLRIPPSLKKDEYNERLQELLPKNVDNLRLRE